jgi:superfamily II DNA or RNA helicase
MADGADDLPPGLYERLLTSSLRSRLLTFDPSRTHVVQKPVDPAEAHATLARHVHGVVERALRALPELERIARQTEVANEIIALLARGGLDAAADSIAIPPEELREIRQVSGTLGDEVETTAPLVPLSASDLLVNARGEPALAHALAREIPSADSIDLLCAFVRWHGLRVLEEELRKHRAAGRPLRVITTVYTGSTERKALDWLVKEIGAQVKVSYDTQSTRLHAKAWMFHRSSGYSTAYIGSSNLSKSALLDGVEWNVRLSQATSPELLEKFDATFDGYWSSPEYEDYVPDRDCDRLDRALSADAATPMDNFVAFLDVQPWPHQREMLEKLAVERERHHRHRNLVVAATGTGKTIVAALDYKRLREQIPDASLLFVAHRQEILRQSLSAFRHVLRQGDFGELYVDGHRPDEWRHVFASVQSLAQVDLSRMRSDAFDVVIVDEFHHAAAPTYRRLLNHLFAGRGNGAAEAAPLHANGPKELLGLTATPERADGESVLALFDDHLSVELRLWDALERGLLCPFQYFGLHDNTDLSSVQWSRRGYDVSELENLYTADDARVRLVLQQVADKLRDARRMRALGFCVSIAHAAFMARKFSEAGLPSQAVSATTDSDARRFALQALRKGDVCALFAVDLFNEGVDLPEVDTLLFLRPTESPVVFMQQLGRGLRRAEGKDCVTVLDFIGQSHCQFRFDLRYRAITGASRREVERQVELEFPFLPAGCTMRLDKIATRIVLDNIRSALPSRRPAMVRELKALLQSDRFRGRVPSLAEFLHESGLELDDVYRSGCWSGLLRDAGVEVSDAGPQEEALGKALNRLLHIDDPIRIEAYREWLTSARDAAAKAAALHDARLITALPFTLFGSDAPATLLESWRALRQHPAILTELQELWGVLEDRAEHLTYPLELEGGAEAPPLHLPLSVHAQHSLVEIMAAVGRATPGRFHQQREGVYRDERTNSDLFFVTLEKSEREYSPTTLYKDYAISPTEFHWESQSTTTQRSKTGQRYIRHRERGGNILLFVRQRKTEGYRTAPYVLLGLADYVSHKRERPISFTWRLRRPMPADFFRQAKVAAG